MGHQNLHGLDLEASGTCCPSPVPPPPRLQGRHRHHRHAACCGRHRQNFVPVVNDRNVFIGMVPPYRNFTRCL